MTLESERYMKHEKEVAKELGLRPSISSGRDVHEKGDAKSQPGTTSFPLYIECKCTGSSSYRLTKSLLDDTERKAVYHGMEPVLAIRLYGSDLEVLRDVVVLDLSSFSGMYQQLLDQEKALARVNGLVSELTENCENLGNEIAYLEGLLDTAKDQE